MSNVDEHLERLINRSLDHDLTEDEQLELNRELIRNPAAHRLFEEYASIDEGASSALKQALEDEQAPTQTSPVLVTKNKREPLRPRGWWLVPGAIAAALLAMVVPYPKTSRTERSGAPTAVLAPPTPSISPWAGTMNVLHPARTTPVLHRNTGTDVIGVVGDDGNLYWIEVERTRTIKLPPKAGLHDSL